MGGIYSKESEPQPPLYDPRSPTPDISRTPILKLDEAKIQKITKNVDLTKECFEKYANNAQMNPAIKLLMNEIDPRSPTLDFQRTPLAVLINDPELIAKYNRTNVRDLNLSNISYTDVDTSVTANTIEACIKNLDNDLANISLNECDNKDDDIISVERFLERESCLTPPLEENVKIITPGLLETNLDYIETDLDTVKRRRKLRPKKIKTITDAENLSDRDPRSPSDGIDRTPIIVSSKKSSRTKKTEIESNLYMKEIFSHNMVLQQKSNERKLTNYNSDSMLIYEDNINEVTVKKVVSQSNEGSRTPLAAVVNNEQKIPKSNTPVKRSAVKKAISRIPVKVNHANMCSLAILQNCHSPKELRNLARMSRMIDISENTPPKHRRARWDQDNSVVL